MATTILSLTFLAGAGLAAPLPAAAAPPAHDGRTRADFNADGFDDLAVGVPQADTADKADSGAVFLYTGGTDGLSFSAVVTQESAGIPDDAEAGDRFGAAVATGFFNADQYLDLAIGVPGEDRGGTKDAGAVQVLYGSAQGLTTRDSLWIDQASPGVSGTARSGDRFGESLAAADFGRSDEEDLAIGVPYEDVGGAKDAGLVQVLYGSAAGITGTATTSLSQDTRSVAGSSEAGDRFGSSLAVGDFGRSDQNDLAIGVPYEDLGRARDAGQVQVFYGSSGGLTVSGDSAFSQSDPAVEGVPETGDRFGISLTSGNFGRSSKNDLAIGVPYEDLGRTADAGLVHVLYGASGALTAQHSEVFNADSPNVSGASERGDHFGLALAAADLMDGAEDELAVGVPDEDFALQGQPSLTDAGAVQVLLGSTKGLTAQGGKELTAEDFQVAAASETGDRWGASLATGNFSTSTFGGGPKADLVIAGPGEDVNSVTPPVRDVGEVSLLVGSDRDFHGDPPGDIVGKLGNSRLAVPPELVKAENHFGSVMSSTRPS